MLPSAVKTMPVPSSPDVPLVTMIDTTEGKSTLAICATDSTPPCAAAAVGVPAELDALTVDAEADADVDGEVATGVVLAVFVGCNDHRDHLRPDQCGDTPHYDEGERALPDAAAQRRDRSRRAEGCWSVPRMAWTPVGP